MLLKTHFMRTLITRILNFDLLEKTHFATRKAVLDQIPKDLVPKRTTLTTGAPIGLARALNGMKSPQELTAMYLGTE